jgi:hypothetical protein
MSVPLLQRVTGERLTGAAALICQNGDLMHKVRMLRPAGPDLGDAEGDLVADSM